MPVYSVSKSFPRGGRISDKAASVMRMFGLSVEALSEKAVVHSCRLEINPGDIVYITGPSGSGKSVILKGLAEAVPADERVILDKIKLAKDKTLVDCIEGDFVQSLKMLSTAGLNDCLCVLNQPRYLSDGQKYRFRLAVALAAKKDFIFADEFCSNLDRVTASVIAYNIHKFAKRRGATFVLASSHEDILPDLRPDVIVVTELAGETRVIYKTQEARYKTQETRCKTQDRRHKGI